MHPLYRWTVGKAKRVFKSHTIPSHHKPFNTIGSLLVSLKEKSNKEKQCSVVYSYKCSEWDKEYIGETARTVSTRFREHTDEKHPGFAIAEHTTSTIHCYTLDDIKILVREDL